MFSNAFNSLKQAATNIMLEVAPPPNTSALDDMRHYWELVKEEHQRLVESSQRDPENVVQGLQDSTIRENLENIVNILRNENNGTDLYDRGGGKETVVNDLSEDGEGEGSHYARERPCLQYLIEERVLEILCAMSLADHPPGMMALVLQTIRLLLIHITEEPLLLHVSVHRPICHMIHVCMEARKGIGSGGFGGRSSPKGGMGGGNRGGGVSVRAQASLVALLEEIWKQVAKEPNLLRVFFGYGREGLSKEQAEQFDKNKRHHHLLIFAALIPYMHVKRKSGDRARSGLMQAVSIRDTQLQEYMLHRSVFCRRVADGLSSAYAALPPSLKSHSEEQDRVAQSALDEFVRRLEFARDLCLKAGEEGPGVGGTGPADKSKAARGGGGDLADAICREVRERFVEDRLRPALMTVSEAGQTAATVYTHTIIQTLCATPKPYNPLLNVIVRSLLGDDTAPEIDPARSPPRKALAGGPRNSRASPGLIELRTVLVHRITSQSSPVSEVTMELFNCLLEVGGSYVLHNLVVRNMTHAHPSAIYAEGTREAQDPTKRFLSFFSGVPLPQGQGSGRELEGDGSKLVFEDYLTDAHKQYVSRMAQYWSSTNQEDTKPDGAKEGGLLGENANKKNRSNSLDKPAAQNDATSVGFFFEGLFFSALMDKLETMLDNSPDENLILTGLWSQMAQCPHPRVHNFLFSQENEEDRNSPEDSCNRTLLSVLQVVWSEAQVRLKQLPEGEKALKKTRARLGTTDSRKDVPISFEDSGNQGDVLIAEDVDVRSKRFLEGVVVLEEFLKEIAGILTARQELNMLS
jgi:hypothetical protein